MQKRSCLFLMILLTTGFFVGVVTTPTVVYGANYADYLTAEFYGASSTSWSIYNTLFEADSDIKSLLNNRNLELWSSDVSLQGLTVDYTEFSYGSHTTDWIGTIGSTTDLAYGGLGFWCPNATSSPLTTTSGNAQVISDPSIATPASGGYKMTATITFDDETTENSDVDGSGRNFLFGSVGDFAGVDIELTANSYVYMNYAFTLATLNTTAIPRLGVYFIIETSGGAHVVVAYSVASGVTTDTAWEDGSTSSLESSLVATTDEDVVRMEINATTTAEQEYVGYYKVDDLLSKSAAYTADSPSAIKEWGYYAASKYSSANSGGTVGTLKVKNLLFVEEDKDLALFEETDTADPATQQLDNFPNATSRTISTADEYVLSHGDAFTIDSDIPINRITFSAYTVIYAPTNTYTMFDRTNLIAQKKLVFDSNPPTDERITDPSTFYLNISSFSATYKLVNIYETTVDTDNDFFDPTNGNLESGYSAADKDSSPTINELKDIYDDLTEIDTPVRFAATSFNTVSDAKMFYFHYYVTSADVGLIDAGASTAGLSFPGLLVKIQQNWLFVLCVGALVVGTTVILLYVLGLIPGTKRDNKRAKKTPTWFKLAVMIVDLALIILLLIPILS